MVSTYSNFKRTMVVSSDAVRKIYISNPHPVTLNAGYFIASISAHSSSSTSPLWAKDSTSKASSSLPLGLVFGESESFLYLFAYQSPNYIVQRLDAATGSPLWTHGFTQTSSIVFTRLAYT